MIALDPDVLRSFIAIAEEGGFARAGRFEPVRLAVDCGRRVSGGARQQTALEGARNMLERFAVAMSYPLLQPEVGHNPPR